MSIYTRKLIKIGRSSIGTILPIAWINGEHLQAGDLIEYHEDNQGLHIKPKKKQHHLSLDITNIQHNLKSKKEKE